MNRYIEFVQGLDRKKAVVIPLEELAVTNNFGCFRSLFVHNAGLKGHFDNNFSEKDGKKFNSVAGYTGQHTADFLLIDFDGDDLDKVKLEVVTYVNLLKWEYEIPEDLISIWFSGNKGFHVTIPFELVSQDTQQTKDFHKHYGAFVEKLTEGFKYVDRGIYNADRLIRLGNTKHEKTKLFKIPVTLDELQDQKFIVSVVAQKARYLEFTEFDPLEWEASPELSRLWDSTVVAETAKPEKVSEPNSFINAMSDPNSQPNRHTALSKIAGMLIDKHIDFNNAMAIARVWDQQNKTPMGEERLQKDMRSFYNSFWDKRPQEKTIVTPEEDDEFEKYLVSGTLYTKLYDEHMDRISKGGRVKTGYERIDNAIRGMIAGEVMTIIGKTSVGKSALVQNILLNNVDMQRRSLFFSLEMPLPTVAERTLQRYLNKSGREIERQYLQGDAFIREEIKEVFEQLGTYFITIPIQGIRYPKIEDYIKRTEDHYGEKLDIVAIDYAGLVKADGDTVYAQQSEISRDMKALSGRTSTSVITLAQVSKQYNEFSEIDLDASRDSGVVVEASDYVVGAWRAKGEDKRKILLHGNVCKNRNGRKIHFNMTMDRDNLLFELDDYDENPPNELPFN
jgi:hypothetical protein